jgi:hypothetical protein
MVEGVITRECCPVMIVNRTMTEERLMFKRVMVSTEFSRSCTYAFKYATKFAQKHDSKLFIFHMLPVLQSHQYTHANYEADLRTVEKKLEALCKGIASVIDIEY